MNPREISITSFTYELPAGKIALHPLAERDSSRLLVYRDKQISDSKYVSIADELPSGSTIIFNNTRVVEARLIFTKPTGGKIEIFCLEPGPSYADITTAMNQRGSVTWNCLIGGASKWKTGQILNMKIDAPEHQLTLSATYLQKLADSFLVDLSWTPQELTFAEVLHEAGNIPLPPYLHREVEDTDKERYQTVYALSDGSVAAPTAGLHFTKNVLKSLVAKDIHPAYLTLHVGAGTFKPVKAATMEEHEMHAEFIDVDEAFIVQLKASLSNPVIAVGTTSLRTLESLYWIGIYLAENNYELPMDFQLDQWYPYETGTASTAFDALSAILEYMQRQGSHRLVTRTRLLIVPGYQFRIVTILVTNFHQPQSTLLLLVAAFAGEDWRAIYEHALSHDYRFLSYGDGCLLFRQ
ncbi:MAG TPA: S-adenosylmethionine:tRNA ribosyltransferase-isomerase [Flavitalea sp.]|nr:S-adenosylmethionine:tRNA ribosyltransferase-isomerase [Flavitalea sp.]